MNLSEVPSVSTLIDLAIDEDLGRGDATTESTIPREKQGKAVLVARETLVLAGGDIAAAVFARVSKELRITGTVADGTTLHAGDAVMAISGSARAILMAERTALNFLQRLCGIATLSSKFAAAVSGTGAKVVDTRKTTPGYRLLSKHAVRMGGCHNHRSDLSSGILIKDNHIAAAGSVTAAVENARAHAPHSLRVEVEVETEKELAQAIKAGADVVLLDNMTPEKAGECVAIAKKSRVLVEVSGGITLETVSSYAKVGVDYISSGALTHSAVASDLALDWQV